MRSVRNQDLEDRVRAWMFDAALPFWGSVGIDHQKGGYVEQLTLDGRVADVGFKRVRVIGRQIYVFSHAYQMGWKPGLELAEHGFNFLTQHAWQGPEAGWARTLSQDGAILDGTADLYDNAFALFALSWFQRVSGSQEAKNWASKTMTFVDQHMRHANGIGFLHWSPASGLRQQNPHMHLLEACLASYEAEPNEQAAILAKEVAGLFETKFFDLKTRTLAEFFDEDFTRAQAPDGEIIEPGHQFEWAWILVNLKRLLGIDLSDHVRALIGFGEDFGVDQTTFATYDSVWVNGRARSTSSRTWPNTERIKAAVALSELDGIDPSAVFAQSIGYLFDNHLNAKPFGTWIDQVDEAGASMSDKIPTSTLYHVFLAFAEFLRHENGRT
jgi:mannose/cellobiose epimerase-like protein (N-acyl-D-glucosamine 2-epimerase family)